jgi:hypothetical protein
MKDVEDRLKELMDNEARSCSMDYGCVTPLYVYRMWGGQVPLNEIEKAFSVQGSWFKVNGEVYGHYKDR